MSDNAPEESPSPWAQRGFIAAAVVVALLVVLGAVLVFTGPDEGRAAPPSPTPTSSSSTPTPTSTDEPNSDSACGLPEGDQTVLAAAPEDTEWELVGTMAAPTAPETHGPGELDDGLRTCFARTPTGALYAAANVVASTSVPQLREPLAQELGADGPGRDTALDLLAATPPAGETSTGSQIVGFTFLNYSEDTSVVDLEFRTSSGGIAQIPLTLRWEDGDWKLVFPPSGDPAEGVQAIPDLTGYVPWGGA